MRRVFALVVIAVALVAVTAASAGRGDPQRAITKADQTRAKSMLLRRADLAAGFVATKPGPDPDWYCAALDESDLTLTGDAESPDFTKQQSGLYLSVSSAAQIYRTAAEALTSWRQGTSPAGERCTRRLFREEADKNGFTMRQLSRVSFPRVAPLTVAYRIVFALKNQPSAPELYGDFVVLQRGRAQAAMVVFSLGAPLVRPELVVFARTISQRMAKAMGT